MGRVSKRFFQSCYVCPLMHLAGTNFIRWEEMLVAGKKPKLGI